jgi:phosphate transport system permease protein
MVTTTAPAATGRRRAGAVGDRVFSSLTRISGLIILVALAAVFVFLAVRGVAGLHAPVDVYQPAASNFLGYCTRLLFGTVVAAVIALVISVPFAIAVALFVAYYAPRWLAAPIAYVIDLLAAVPSVVFGLWGYSALAPATVPLQSWLNEHASWVPLFGGNVTSTGRSMLVAGVVLAIMILPITTAISREVFSQTPRLQEEAALALGATRWEMIRYAVLPHARSGVIAGVMLGLGRALGETMAVLMVLSAAPRFTERILTANNSATIASNIAAQFSGEDIRIQSVLIATGLVLFVFTFLVNLWARTIVARAERKFA